MFESLKKRFAAFAEKAEKELETEGGAPAGKDGREEAASAPRQDEANKHSAAAEKKIDSFGNKPQKMIVRKRAHAQASPQSQVDGIKTGAGGMTQPGAAQQQPTVHSISQDIQAIEAGKAASPASSGAGGGIFVDGFGGKKLSDKKLDAILWDLQVLLLESDVALEVAEKIKEDVKANLMDKKIKMGASFEDVIGAALKSAISDVLDVAPIDFDKLVAGHQQKPLILMFVGVNGTGKTTAIARIAYRLQQNKKTCVIAACDTFRAGAIEQLERHAEKLGVKLIKQQSGSDPAAVAYDAIEHAKAKGKDVVLIDTAGRMQTNTNLMDEMKKVKRVANPQMIIFVGDSLTGNDATEQARKFNEAVGIDAAILTKIDVDTKGGAALSIAYTIKKPIIFVGVGQEYKDLVPFNSAWMTERLFGA